MKQTDNLKKFISITNSQDNTKKVNQSPFDYWFKRHRYYHQLVTRFYQSMVPKKSRVLHIQCTNGSILQKINPKTGVGVEKDVLSRSIIQKQYPQYMFYSAIKEIPEQKFDYILLSFATMQAEDIHYLFLSLQRFCHPDSRIIVESYHSFWSPILWLTQKVGIRRPTQLKNWISTKDLNNFASLADFEVITTGAYILMPIRILLVAWIFNTIIAHLPLFNRLCLNQWMLVRPKPHQRKDVTVSVIIPCRNEKGNIEKAIIRAPQLGLHTELIFVEGHSIDGTAEEIKRVVDAYPNKDIHCYTQKGKGKGDAVRTGFAYAKGEILIILDADLTTPPEEMSKFYDALVNGNADFINGSRLIYNMESDAMGLISWIANRFFGWIISWIIGQPVTDTLCGTKVLWKKDYEAIAANRPIMGLWDPFGDFDLLFGAAKLNLKIRDIPIHYKRRTYGKTNIFRFKEVWFLIWMCMRAWWLLRVQP